MRRGTKQKIVDFDAKYLHGLLAKIYDSNENRIMTLIDCKDSFFKMKKAVVLREPVADMLLMQMENTKDHYSRYQAYDYAVRYLAVENYYGKNDFGFELYKKMHTRGGITEA